MNDVEPPRISRRRAIAITVAGLTVAGALVGALWAWLAPPIHGVVALTKSGERIKAYLGNEADHFFIAAFLIVGMLGVVAVVAAVLLWQWRAHRGPVMAAALSIGLAAGAGAGAGVGAVLTRLRYGAIDMAGAPVSPEHRVHYVVEAPAVFFGHAPLQIAATILLPAAAAALVYALMAVSTARDDLGAWPPVEEPVLGPPTTAESALPSAQ
jgi:MFS family permease